MDHIDGGTPFDWGRTSADYAKYRPGYPASFYELLRLMGIGLAGQRILDLGTGTGELAINFAAQGAEVTGLDLSEGQLAEAERAAGGKGVRVDWKLGAAEDADFAPAGLDAVTASMCWHYFDKPKVLPVIRRILKPAGLLLVSRYIWLPFESRAADETEKLIAKYSPGWTAGGQTGEEKPVPDWDPMGMRLTTFHTYKADIPFTHESWRGRIRASRGVGASLAPDRVREFDAELAALLGTLVPEHFTVKHLITVRIFEN